MRPSRLASLLFPVLLTLCGTAYAAEPDFSVTPSADSIARAQAQIAGCPPGGNCTAPLPVKVVIISLFEIGQDTGDTPGEFQLWRTRRHLDMAIPFPQGFHDLAYNPQTQVLAVLTGIGTARSSNALTALALDQRLDLSHAYFLLAGIAGIDPEDASVGSAAWARYLVDGDLAHEIDPREVPKGWKTGYFPRDGKGPGDPVVPKPDGELFTLNPALVGWAYGLTREMKLPDDPVLAAERKRYAAYPMAQKPPFVLVGDQLSAMTFWHGKLLNDWANDWVHYWTQGKGNFVTAAMEDTGVAQAMTFATRTGRVDYNRLMVLRAGSNHTVPPPGVSAYDNLMAENAHYTGLTESVENLYRVGSVVVDELLGHWDRYGTETPGGEPAR